VVLEEPWKREQQPHLKDERSLGKRDEALYDADNNIVFGVSKKKGKLGFYLSMTLGNDTAIEVRKHTVAGFARLTIETLSCYKLLESNRSMRAFRFLVTEPKRSFQRSYQGYDFDSKKKNKKNNESITKVFGAILLIDGELHLWLGGSVK